VQQTSEWVEIFYLHSKDSRLIHALGSCRTTLHLCDSYQQCLAAVNYKAWDSFMMPRQKERKKGDPMLTTFLALFLKLLSSPVLVAALAKFLANAMKSLV
jgi:hypothetical protein